MTETTKKRRIFHIAKELNISHVEIMTFLKDEGVAVSSHMAPVDADVYDKILGEFAKERQQIERLRKEQARQAVVSSIKKQQKTDAENDTIPSPKKASPSDSMNSLKERISNEKRALGEAKRIAEEELQKRIQEAEALSAEKIAKDKAVTENPIEPETPQKRKLEKPEINVGLKVVRRATDAEKEKMAKHKENEQRRKDDKKKKKEKPKVKVEKKTTKVPEVVPKPRKLKKIDLSAIADRINQSKRGPKGKDVPAGKAGPKQPLPQFGRKSAKKKPKKKEKVSSEEVVNTTNIIKLPEFTTVDELAQSMNIKVQEVIMACMGLGMMVSINQRLDMESMIMVADEFDFEIETLEEYAEESTEIQDTQEDIDNAEPRAAVVTVMGHVDHGKTSLLDYIRNENVVAGESGGITQHIGAYEVTLKNDTKMTFLDTPGHAAFTAMRSRGAQVTDIVVVIVAADDSVMPQTIEAIDHAKAASVPIIIAINKVDLPAANVDNIKKKLSEQNILVEDWGGKYQCQEISAKSGLGIDDLLEKIQLEAEVLDLKANRDTLARGVVVESRLDKGLGAIATVLIQKGTLKRGDIFVCGTQSTRVRAMLNERGNTVTQALPSDPVQILGFTEVPNAGDMLTVFGDEKEAKRIAQERSQIKREAEQRRFRKLTLDQIGKQISAGAIKELDIIIKGDVDGSIEALSDSLMGLSGDEVSVKIIHRSVGMITENDVNLAGTSGAIVIAFNVNASAEAKARSKTLGVDIRQYSIIYEAINEVKLALEGILEPEEVEEALGYAEVRDMFKIPKLGLIAGCSIQKGKVIRNALLRVKRGDEILHEGKLTSLKRFKDDVNEVLEGFECGIGVHGFTAFEAGDIIEVYEIKEIKRSLA
ncbi:MAG: translation initiation factor IF-2 [Candidatus Marinimicrobia bacterium]|nr:translation initiation factor IF-2 [Candidatus Neomarinimicrobiota bacterium]